MQVAPQVPPPKAYPIERFGPDIPDFTVYRIDVTGTDKPSIMTTVSKMYAV